MQVKAGQESGSTFEVASALTAADTGSEAIRNLYRNLKKSDKKYSLAYICKRAKIPSTGYLSDVVAGKRQLNKKYWTALAKALLLKPVEEEYFVLLLRRDSAKLSEHRQTLDDQLLVTRKSLLTRTLPMPRELMVFSKSLEVFCAFGLFRNAPTMNELLDYFGREQTDEVLQSLLKLKDLKLITDDQDKPGHYKLLSDQILFNEEQGGLSHIDFLRLSLAQAGKDAELWFDKKDHSHFVSSIISVKDAAFRDKLPQLKDAFLNMQSDLEAGDADRLIRFNVQLYPIK